MWGNSETDNCGRTYRTRIFTYISDLPNNPSKVWRELKKMKLSDYPKSQKAEFSRYVFGNSFTILFLN